MLKYNERWAGLELYHYQIIRFVLKCSGQAARLPGRLKLTQTSCSIAAGLAGTTVVLQVALGPTVAGVLTLAQISTVRRVRAEAAVETGRLLAPAGQVGAGGPPVSRGTNTARTAGGGGGGGGGEERETDPAILLTLHLAICWGGAGTGGCNPVVTCSNIVVIAVLSQHPGPAKTKSN